MLPCAVSSIAVNCSDGIVMFGKELARGNEKGTAETTVDTQRSPMTAIENDSMLTMRDEAGRPRCLLDKIMWSRIESFVGQDGENELATRRVYDEDGCIGQWIIEDRYFDYRSIQVREYITLHCSPSDSQKSESSQTCTANFQVRLFPWLESVPKEISRLVISFLDIATLESIYSSRHNNELLPDLAVFLTVYELTERKANEIPSLGSAHYQLQSGTKQGMGWAADDRCHRSTDALCLITVEHWR